jgi:hypothetical protein
MWKFLFFGALLIGGYLGLFCWVVVPSEEQRGELAGLAYQFTEACKELSEPEEIRQLELRAWEARERIFFDPLARPWRCKGAQSESVD